MNTELDFQISILTQMEMDCCPVAVQFGGTSGIFAHDLYSFSVELYRVISFSFSVFLVAFTETFLCYN